MVALRRFQSGDDVAVVRLARRDHQFVVGGGVARSLQPGFHRRDHFGARTRGRRRIDLHHLLVERAECGAAGILLGEGGHGAEQWQRQQTCSHSACKMGGAHVRPLC